MQFDFYHVQIEAGDLITRFRRHLPVIGHVQVAAVPSRAEPDEGEVNYPALFEMIDRAGYAGWIGCEYKPRGTHRGRARLVPGLRHRRLTTPLRPSDSHVAAPPARGRGNRGAVPVSAVSE